MPLSGIFLKQIMIISDLQRRGPRDDLQEEARLGWSGRTGRRANPRLCRGCLVGRSLHALLGRDDKRAGRDDKRGLSRDDKGSFRTVHCSCHCNHSMPAVISSGARSAKSRNLTIGQAILSFRAETRVGVEKSEYCRGGYTDPRL